MKLCFSTALIFLIMVSTAFAESVTSNKFEFIDVYALQKHKEYILSDPIAIHRKFDPEDMTATVMSKRQLPSLATFKVLEAKELKWETWYNVMPFNEYGEPLELGWIRSNHLARQHLKIKGEETSAIELKPTERTKTFFEILSPWKPIDVEEGNGIFHVHLPHSNVTNQIYETVLKTVCLNILYDDSNLEGIEKIIITNRKKDRGYIFSGGQKECETLNKDINISAMEKTKNCTTDCFSQ
jgi:hypothetical protein